MTAPQAKPDFPVGIYGITAEKFSNGRTNVEVVRQMLAGGIRIIQYREKRPHKSFAEMLAECRAIRALTRGAGALFIVNDYPSLALLSDADGVHVGQDDLPVPEVRRLVGPHLLIGLSTHDPDQAAAAVTVGADYIGVGPLFATQTKDDVCAPVGLGYLEHAVATCPLPFVAIGGIKEHNITDVARHGARCCALVSELVGAPDIAAKVQAVRAAMQRGM